ncbi:MAG: hypothetical protein JWO02_3883, partial [Solirubrobacterales bacterium]|nr:hypothetical protein [Solirubrobacterales bacterium]
MEVGDGQAPAARALAPAGWRSDAHADLAGVERVVVLWQP